MRVFVCVCTYMCAMLRSCLGWLFIFRQTFKGLIAYNVFISILELNSIRRNVPFAVMYDDNNDNDE
jgi:hypothetical protein